jgi:hypothetical protein
VVEVEDGCGTSLESLIQETIAEAWGQSVEELLENSGETGPRVIGFSELDEVTSRTSVLFRRDPN